MLAKLLHLLTLEIVSVAMESDILTTERQQIALCVETVVQRYFTKGEPVLVSMPSDETSTQKSPASLAPYDSDRGIVSLTLNKLHENAGSTIRLSPPSEKIIGEADVPQGYIIFIWPNDDDGDVIESLRTQVDELKELEGGAWNPQGKFLVVVTGPDHTPPRDLALQIYGDLWKEHSISDNTILIPNRDKHVSVSGTRLKRDALELYTAFPYEGENCGEVTQVNLMDRWHIYNNEGFSYNVNLFPPKIPNNFRGCEIRVGSAILPPFVIPAGNTTHSDGSIVYKLHGLAVHNILLLADKINTTVVFLSPSQGFTEQNAVAEGGALAAGVSDIVIGALLLLPVFQSSTFRPTVPYTYVTIKLYVPCPKPVAGTDRVFTTYEVSVWLTMATVFIVINVVWWCMANWRYSSVKESATFKTLSHCFYNAWAVSVGVSVPEMPKNCNLRFLFLLYVCYCFAMSNVFQAFFISYLVQPGHEKKFETVDEVLHSAMFYGYNELYETGMDMMGYNEHRQFPSSRRLDCSDMMKCLQRIVTDADLCTLSAPPFIQYLSSQMGIHDHTKHLCTLEEDLLTTGFISVLRNGSPFLNRVNALTQRVLEAGLLDRYWAELMWNVKLRSNKRVDEDDQKMYFVFSLSHVSPAFSVLFLGHVFSAIVFLSEIFFKKIRELQRAGLFSGPMASPL
jgi:hypothetical protein